MRVLFSAVPEAGHLNPLFPLARALVKRGHSVAFASSPRFGARAEASGFEAYPTGDEFDAWYGELMRRVGGPPGEGLAPEEIERWFVPRLFAQVGAENTIADLIALLETWRPDLAVHDTYQFAAPLAATLGGVPYVSHGLGPLPPLDIFAAAGDAVAPLWQQYGSTPPPFGGVFVHACLSISPPALESPLPAEIVDHVWPLRPVGYDAGGRLREVPDWLDSLANRPVVYGTLGTFLNTDMGVFRAILDGLAGEDLEVILTVGENNDPAALEPVPPNAHVERYIPQSHLLDRCAALVCHGGSGTILPALGRGIPLVLIPQGADNFTNAGRCADAGVGLVLRPGEVSPDAVRTAVRRVLDDEDFKVHARDVGAEIAAMPEPDDVSARLEYYVGMDID